MKKTPREVTLDELNFEVPIVCHTLIERKGFPIYAGELVKIINDWWASQEIDKSTSQMRLRVMINYLRRNEVLPIMSGNQGYWISYKKEEVIAMAESLELRARSIQFAANGLRNLAQQFNLPV